MKVVLTELAEETLREITDFLKHKWTQRELDSLLQDYYAFLSSLDDKIIKPRVYKTFDSKIHYALIGKKQVTIFFEFESEQTIKILLFWANKKNPSLLKNLLNKG